MPLPVGPQFGLNYQRARVVTTFADITASLTVAEGLRQSKERYEHLVESLPLVVLQIDRDLNITFLNRVTMRLTGYAEDELRAPGFWLTLVDPADRAGLTAALEQALRGEPGSFEFRLRTRLGQTKSVLSLLQPRPAEDCCTALIVDLTVQRHLERELQNAQRLDLVGRLASGTVHDFNNLLTVMIGISHIAKMQLPEEHVIQADLDRVIEAGEQAAHLAGQLLTFSRQRPLAQNAVDLNETVRQTLKLLRGVLTKAIQFDAELSSEPALVRGSETQLKQVLMNLCLNARDAMPSGGRLVVRVGSSASIADNGQAEVFLTVEDSGQGMNEEVRSHIFEAFYSTKEHGTGLGLAVVRQIVNEMGGRIEVSSTPGAGTRMELRFRVYEPSDVLEEQPA
jgi:PAS domain S-box-containing protein